MRNVLLSTFILTTFASVAAAEKVDNPLYKSWANYKIGTYIVMKSTGEAGGYPFEQTVTRTLKEVTDEKVVIEMTGVNKVMGMNVDMPATSEEIEAKVPKGQVDEKHIREHVDEEHDIKYKEREETIEIKGKKIKTHYYESKGDGSDAFMVKYWESEEIPGRMVKTVTENSEMKTTMEIVDMKLVKR
jgi:hypothetical protein